MATNQDRAKCSIAVEVKVACEAPRWLVPQVIPTSPRDRRRTEDDRPMKPDRASQGPTREVVLVNVGFNSLEELTAEASPDKSQNSGPLSGLYSTVKLVVFCAITLLAGANVIQLPETVKTELGKRLTAIALTACLHWLRHR
jgi:hypothetical protein